MASSKASRIGYTLLGAAILLVAAYFRVESAGLRQYHADEGVQSYQAWRLIEKGEYRYDPAEHHGPTLYYLTSWAYPLIADEQGELSDFRMRLVPMAFSLGSLLFGLWAFRDCGRANACLWAGIVAIAPLAVIYGPYYIQESLLAFFTLWAAFAAFRYLEAPSFGRALAIGASVGAMHITKETAALHVLALLVAVVGSGMADAEARSALARRGWRDAALALSIAVLLHVLFFSSFFTNTAGIWEAIVAYFNYADRAQGQGHEKHAWYYLGLLLPHTREGIGWSESVWLCAAGIGLCWIGWDRVKAPSRRARFAAFLGLFGLLVLLLYMAIPYKTPWLLLTPYMLLSYAAAYAIARASNLRWSARSWLRFAPAGLGLLLAFLMGHQLYSQNRLAVARFPSASRNPYLYEHTTGRYDRLLARLERVTEAAPERPVSIGVYSPDGAWPLPWHLRRYERVGYWNSLDTYRPHDIDLIDTRLSGDSALGRGSDDFWELHGLRPNTLVTLRVAEDLKRTIINP